MKKFLCVILLLILSSPAFSQASRPPLPGGVPDVFGMYANYANSPLPLRSCSAPAPQDPAAPSCYGDLDCAGFVDQNTGVVATCSGPVVIGTGIRKFVDPLPSLAIAVPDTITYPGSDYYEIELREYTQKFHSELPPTTLRGYVQVNKGTDTSGQNTISPPAISYLGPAIVATSGRPVRVKFTNKLPTGAGGNLFIPTDTTYMGAGEGPVAGANYTQNRATLHLHGGTTPWISDGTPHQWITPAGENTAYPEGVSVYNVPDMANAGKPGTATNPSGSGSQTFFYSNQQSARLMFYHDHAYGITRLNVYAGEAAGYLLTDQVEQDLINGTNNSNVNPGFAKPLPGIGIPLVIQDKTFVWGKPPVVDNTTNTVSMPGTGTWATDPTWNWGTKDGTGAWLTDANGNLQLADLWYPHVYMPNQNPEDLSGANPMGRWDYGPWFWPPFTGLQNGPIPNPYYDPNCVSSDVQYCEPSVMPGTPENRGIAPSGVPEAFMDTPVVNGAAYPYLEVQPQQYRFRILNAANDRFLNLSFWVADPNVTTADSRTNTEVKMVPFNSSQNQITPFPAWWYTAGNPFSLDDRAGGVPDPTTRGPAMIQIGTEGGFLPAPAVIKNQPVNYNYNRRDITVLNVLEKALFLGPAERADIIVDFSKFAGKTLILYNDSPAPVPAADPRLDYYTGDPDQTDTGGAPSTQPGYGPNTRTIMQIRVAAGADSSAPVDYYDPATLTTLQTLIPAAFAASQDTIIVPQRPYNAAYNGNFPGDASAYVKIQDTSFAFRPVGQSGTGSCTTTPTGCVTADLEPKSIIEDFQVDYGRMNALLGVEIAHTNNTNQTSIIQTYIDPPTEVVKFSDGKFVGTNLGTLADGTQIWKITHNGVDTHAMHFHMFNVQLINRVGWDGAIKPPDPNELGWKDTIRTNPLEDIIVALRPITLTNLPFELPNSVRPLDVTRPIGSDMGFTGVDPAGLPVAITNQLTNYGWEFVWHCHLLGHEENDMMRAMAMAVPPKAPLLQASVSQGQVNLSWTTPSLNVTSYTLQRATDPAFTNPVSVAVGTATTYSDTAAADSTFYYRVLASNTVGSTVPGYPTMTVDAPWSNVAVVVTPPLAASGLAASLAGPPLVVNLRWNDNSRSETGFRIERATGFGAFAAIGQVGTNVTSFADTTASPASFYRYRVIAFNAAGDAPSSNIAGITTPTLPAAPTSLTLTASQPGVAPLSVTARWSDQSGNETGFSVERADSSGVFGEVLRVGANTTSATDTTVGPTTQYTYRVRAYNASGYSAYTNIAGITTQSSLPPNAPTNVRVTNVGNNSITLGWTDASNNELRFEVQRSLSANGPWTTIATLPANTTQFRNSQLNRRTTYYYQVRAVNDFGSSGWSPATPVSATTN